MAPWQTGQARLVPLEEHAASSTPEEKEEEPDNCMEDTGDTWKDGIVEPEPCKNDVGGEFDTTGGADQNSSVARKGWNQIADHPVRLILGSLVEPDPSTKTSPARNFKLAEALPEKFVTSLC